MEAFAKLLSALVLPLVVIDIIGGTFSGIWLAILGDWWLIFYGILATISSSFLLVLAITPGLFFSINGVKMLEKGNKVGGYLFSTFGLIYTIVILTIWCIVVLLYYTVHAEKDSIIPALIWSYGIATGPIAWLAQKDLMNGNDRAMITTIFIKFGYIINIFAILLVGISLLDSIAIFCVSVSISLFLQLYISYIENKYREYY